MPRIYFPDILSRQNYFDAIKEVSKLTWNDIAHECKISIRHLTDLRKGVYSLSQLKTNLIREKFGIELPKNIIVKEDYWYIPKAAELGGKRHFELYGPPPATRANRRKGGFNSRMINILRHTGFVVAKNIIRAPKNTNLAEIIGALMGDGGLTLTQAHITLNLRTDKEYAIYLRNLIERLFKINASLYERSSNSTIDVVVSSVKLISFLRHKGLPVGDKIRQGLDIPKWIYKRKKWQRACLRVLLRREKEVLRFFKEFKPSNSRHYVKLREFLEGYRSGYNGVASKATVRVTGP